MARNSFQTTNLTQPAAGSVAIDVLLDFTIGPVLNLDITAEFLDGVIDFVQSVYIDNADNASPLDLVFHGAPVDYRIRVKANTQGWYPIAWPKGPGRFVASSAGVLKVNIIVANYAMPYLSWATV